MPLWFRVTAPLRPFLNTIRLRLNSGVALTSGGRGCSPRGCRVKGSILLVMLLGTAGNAAAQYALSPLPRIPTACQLGLAQLAQFQPLPALAGADQCVAADVVLLQAVMLSDKTKVAVVPPATLRCTMAEQVARWVRDDVAPAAKAIAGAFLRRLDNLDSYECRGQNRIRGARLSEHGRANAFDVGAFRVADGRVLGLTDVKVAKAWREVLRASACARFATVLGPGSDGYHEEHVHLDLAEHRNGYKMCQWDVREPVVEAQAPAQSSEQAAARIEDPVPLPRPRPSLAAGVKATLQPMKIDSQVR
jgi:Extensin-like protein C-terminus